MVPIILSQEDAVARLSSLVEEITSKVSEAARFAEHHNLVFDYKFEEPQPNNTGYNWDSSDADC